jgi:hypothetical protein
VGGDKIGYDRRDVNKWEEVGEEAMRRSELFQDIISA